MRLIPAALILMLFATTALAQEWVDFTSREDRFTVNMPGQPKVETIQWPSEYGLTFPGRVYSAMRGAEKYSITAIDYSDAEKRYYDKPHPPSFRQAEYWMMDIQGSIQYAATKLYRMRPGVKVTHDAWHYIDLVEGHQLNMTNADGTRTFVGIYLHDNRLYILDGTVPANGPEPGLFTQSLSFLDAEGKRVRYNQIYSNKLPPETLGERGGGGGGRGRGQGPGQGQ
ncbi:MAG TPA: hypothetical protein VIK60_10525 [Vicinamibacterales bacterium]